MKTEIYNITARNEMFWNLLNSFSEYIPNFSHKWKDGYLYITAPEEWFGNIDDEFAAFCWKEAITMIKIKNWFELNQKYKFEVTDLTTLIYVLCTILGIIGINITPLFLIGSIIATAFSWQGHRINLIVLNASLFLLNLVNFIKMF